MAPANITIQRVEKPADGLIEASVQLFKDLMIKAPATHALTTGKPELIDGMARASIRPIALVAGEMYTAVDENDALIGFTLWLPPGSNIWTTEEQRQMGLDQFLETLSPEGQEYYTNVLGKEFPGLVDGFLGIEHAETNMYWCNFAMVREDYQGKGILRAMFEHVFPKAQELGATMGLATTSPRNVAIYNKLGFTTRGEKVMQSPWGEWPVWVFSREPLVNGSNEG
ncbi:hypothetical protein CERSUDRAFT_119368 [Gelatoporia subvermispora B]|uniref:N-acetyltransferase domain-containing protein n=1 Tax=Ceriporiopsis subvermispora (strain B) TaxID=914234 RepID=M2P8R8_CERS8|nr:hypothetical protein CERSUDRAFT_119368 [Gelatoporia subvermispora B]